MASQASLAVKAGILVLAGLLLLIGFSLHTGGNGWFNPGYELIAEFESAKGIEPGSPVALAGVPIGRVKSLELSPSRAQVRMLLQIDIKDPSTGKPYQVAADAVGSIRLKTLLGNYHLYITHGSPNGPTLKPHSVLRTEEFRDVAELLQDLGQATHGPGSLFGSLKENQQKLFSQLEEVLAENRANVKSGTAAFAQAGPKLNQLLDNLNTISGNIAQGQGTLGKLAKDEKLYGQIQRIADNAEEFSAKLNQGQGTLARLANDEALGRQVATAVDNVNGAAVGVRGLVERNQEPLTQAIHSAAGALPKFEQGMEQFSAIGRKINDGQGTLGKLVNDPALYNDVRDTVNRIRRTFEEGEEQGVMRTFLAVFAGSVI